MTVLVKAESIMKIGGRPAKQKIADAVANFMMTNGDSFKLDTVRRDSHFLGQVSVESGGFSLLEENLNYSAKRLMAVWPRRFNTLAIANEYAHNPEKLAIFTYGSRMGNRAGTRDGWLYRGSALKMITGKENFTNFTAWIKNYIPDAPDFVEEPDLMRTEQWAIWPAVWYWDAHNCYKYADANDVTGLTKVINGGTIGLNDRKAETYQALTILTKDNENIDIPPHPENNPPANGPESMIATYQRELSIIGDIDGIPEYNLKDDGWYGPATRKAISLFQTNHKMEVTGAFDDTTIEVIEKILEVENA